jgi:methyl-accepting chemotaxis protein
VRESAELAERVAASVARQRALIEGAAERAGMAAARSDGLGASASRVIEAFERLGVVALNAGLEGARVSEPQGRALLLLAEEIRANVARGADAAAELGAVAQEISAESTEARRQLERSRAEVADVGQEAARLRASSQRGEEALGELRGRLREATGIDPDMARAIETASTHARALVDALSALSSAGPSRAVTSGLAPVMAPLERLLAELAQRDGASPAGGPRPPGDGRGGGPKGGE